MIWLPYHVLRSRGVAPYAGAWIETIVEREGCPRMTLSCRRPLRGGVD